MKKHSVSPWVVGLLAASLLVVPAAAYAASTRPVPPPRVLPRTGTVALPAPTNLTVTAGDMSNTLVWKVSGRTALTVYVFRGPTENGPWTLLTPKGVRKTSTYTDPVTTTGTVYYTVARGISKGTPVSPGTPAANSRVLMSAAVGPVGRTLTAANGAFALSVPAGALGATTTITIEQASAPASDGSLLLAPAYSCSPDGLSFAVPATLSLRYRIPALHFQVAATLESALDLGTLVGSRWTAVPSVTDTSTDMVTGDISHFSYWSAPVIQPHGTTPSKTSYCTGICHGLVAMPGSTIGLPQTARQTCYNCHGNQYSYQAPAGSNGVNIEALFYECDDSSAPASATAHPVDSGLLCTDCHNPHRDPTAGYADLLRAYDAVTGRAVEVKPGVPAGAAYCQACHGTRESARIASRVPGYWARTGGDKKTGYATSAHASQEATGAVTCTLCHRSHGGAQVALLPARQGLACTGSGAGACHSNAANAAGGSNIYSQLTTSTNNSTHHDVMPTAQAGSGARIECSNCHNVHKDSAASPISDPDNIAVGLPVASVGIVDSNGSAWLRVGAEHDGVPPVISLVARDGVGARWNAPQITWRTNEPATTWIDWGTTTAYELGSIGDNTLATVHTVNMPGLSLLVTYHYRIRTVDALGNVAYSADYTYTPSVPPPAPTLIPMIDTTIYSLQAVTFSWNPVTAPDGDPCQYEVYFYNPANWGYEWSGGWTATGATTFTEYGIKYTGDVTWMVRARDAVHQDAVGAWSAQDVFYLTDTNPDPSCPTLYTWDGDEYRFVTDVMGLGQVGVKKGPTAYVKPEPVEDSIIPPGSLVARDGVLDIRLTDEKPEIEFIDEIALRAVDHPVGTRLLTNDLHWGAFAGGREPTEYFTIADPQPVMATYERLPVLGTETVPETDVSDLVAIEGDGQSAMSGLYDDNIWTFDLGQLGNPEKIKLVVAGWVDYANAPEKAAWIASGKRPPKSCIEVMDAAGNWVAVADAPHPPGYPKTVVYDLTGLFPEGVTDYKVRMRVYMRMNLDYVAVDTTPDAAVEITELVPTGADLGYKGLSAFTKSPYPTFDYEDVVATEPKLQEGAFTRYGDVRELLLAPDDMFVVMNAGDDLAVTFDEPVAPAAGLERTYMIHTDGFHQTISGRVDPMPFHAMSNYPYPAEEHYPDDAEHRAYLAEWNTRRYGYAALAEGESSLLEQAAGLVRGILGLESENRPVAQWLEYHEPIDTSVAVAEGPFSVDTDEAYALVMKVDGTTVIVPPAAGWETATASFATSPTVTSPGTLVSSARLANVTGRNGVYWRSEVSTANLAVNWQMMRFDMPVPATAIRSVKLVWYGHGEPTPTYESRVDAWNAAGGSWINLRNAMTTTNVEVTYKAIAGQTAMCIKCHDGAPPAGVVFPAGGLTNMSSWSQTTGDFHGGRTGWGYGSTLNGYTRGVELPCGSCHASHGSKSINHFPSSIDGVAVGTVSNGTQVRAVCAACHTGTLQQYHAGGGCNGCHTYGGHDGTATSLDIVLADCFDCHQHGASWVHPNVGGCWDDGSGCHLPPSSDRTF